jgi:hypothetical protein
LPSACPRFTLWPGTTRREFFCAAGEDAVAEIKG